MRTCNGMDYELEAVWAVCKVLDEKEEFAEKLQLIADSYPEAASFGAKKILAIYEKVKHTLVIQDDESKAYFEKEEGVGNSLAEICLKLERLLDGQTRTDAVLMTAIIMFASNEDDIGEPSTGEMLPFLAQIDALAMPNQRKWMCVDLFRHFDAHLATVKKQIAPIVEALKEQEALFNELHERYYSASAIAQMDAGLNDVGVAMDEMDYIVQPSVFSYNTLTVEMPESLTKPFGLALPSFFYLGVLCFALATHKRNDEELIDERLQKLRALNDKMRLKMLAALAEGPKYTKELIALTGISAATMSHHTSELMTRRFITLEKDGASIIYALHKGNIKAFLKDLEGMLLK